MSEPKHISVLLKESLDPLLENGGGVYLDCTFGGGGHTAYLLASAKVRRVFAIDRDPAAHERAATRFPEEIASGRLVMLSGDYGSVKDMMEENSVPCFDGVILDAGISSFQVDNPERGFSFSKPGPLDMRMDTEQPLTAYDIVNKWSARELEKIFFEYGEEALGRRIAHKIVERRASAPLENTAELAKLVSNVYGPKGKIKKIHPATKVFQALRLAVNQELEGLEKFLEAIPAILCPGGVVSVISFHSLEDRLVKIRFRYLSSDCICPPEIMTCPRCHKPPATLLTKKPVVPSTEEIENNPRARSAKLRILKRNGSR